MTIALTRDVPPSIATCELSYLERTPIDVDKARQEHARYEQTLAELGLTVQRLPAAPDLPDSVFVEDTAVVLDQIAVLARPGAASRRPELPSVAAALAAWRPVHRIEAPGTLDGGDVLLLGDEIVVGRSRRTNDDGVQQLARLVAPFGLTVRALAVTRCLHLKSAVTRIGPRALAINPEWIDAAAFPGWDLVTIDPAEPHAANVLWVGDALVVSAQHPRTAERLSRRGWAVHTVPAAELAKAEGGVTCCTLLVR